MPLTFNVTECVDYDKHYSQPPYDKTWHPITGDLSFFTMWTGINKITEKNYVEFFSRCVTYCEAAGVEAPCFSLEDVQRHIGLGTNASPKSKAEFNREVGEILSRRVRGSA